ncbi:MAG: arsenosugar biosynthesis radical SAM protein ArsS [Verrucomicrobiales bacterium]|nr:arsenosugar biosynthesis radical SAM protein ArsS [Verrucomicrobiales bacterium]
MNRFATLLAHHQLSLQRGRVETLQINVGKKCNQACRHCHVDAAPWRTEMMEAATARRIEDWIRQNRPAIVDITGGAPELSEHFRSLVEVSRDAGCRVLDRNNLTILEEPGFEWLPEFLASCHVEVVASLPCYLEKNVNQQRGNGAFAKSIAGLRKLNQVGYGMTHSLTLVFNPLGPTLPPPQAELEEDYRQALWDNYAIRFTQLIALTNQPIARFAEDLRQQEQLGCYLDLLATHFNPDTLPRLMCRNTLSVDFQGRLYDCDFNQMLGISLGAKPDRYLWDVTPEELDGGSIRTGDHCVACTAGCGSSCQGALQEVRSEAGSAVVGHLPKLVPHPSAKDPA